MEMMTLGLTVPTRMMVMTTAVIMFIQRNGFTLCEESEAECFRPLMMDVSEQTSVSRYYFLL